MLDFQWKYTAHTWGVCCGESEHLIGSQVCMDLDLVLYCHLLLIHLPTAQDAVTCCTWELALGMAFGLTKF